LAPSANGSVRQQGVLWGRLLLAIPPTPLVAGDGIYLRCARQFEGHVISAKRARHVEITTYGVVLQRVLAALSLSAAKGLWRRARLHGVTLT
jgi:hypothetical protein